jgi:type IV secretory pathway VirB10-like protein
MKVELIKTQGAAIVDIVKMLMIYMSATLALSVQAAPTPEITPVPTAVVTPAPTPTATPEIEEITPEPTQAPTETPAPTVSVTPRPVPTITPNVKKYRNLAMGSKGAEVRRLQERLIELGYLPEGSADGVYGSSTAAALSAFQAKLGMAATGAADVLTQEKLFADDAPTVDER